MSQPIDVTQDGKERGAGRAFLSPKHKASNARIEATDEPLDRLTLALRSANLGKLKSALVSRLRALDEVAALRVGAELTCRGIAPFARGITLTDDWVDVYRGATEPLLLLLDLQWISATYPDHSPEWRRSKSLFNSEKFRKEANYLINDGQRSAGQIVKALALSVDQQRECLLLQCLHIARWRKCLDRRLPIARTLIASGVRNTTKDKRADEELGATIERRSDLWLCAEMANWKPQRTAVLYKMLTDETITRQATAVQIGKLPKVRQSDENPPPTGTGWGT